MIACDSILTRKNDAALKEYIQLCSAFRSLNSAAVYRYAINAIRYYKSNARTRDLHVMDMELENRWYASLADGKPDYSVYDDDRYVGDLWACWLIYSRQYLIGMKSFRPIPDGRTLLQAIGPVRHVMDLGCGCGYTTAGLKEIFPSADVYGTNLSGTLQFAVASRVGSERSFCVVPSVHDVYSDRIDLVLGSEYFEHIERPVEHLVDVLNRARPRVLVLANAFGARSTGHFNHYRHKQAVIRNNQIGRFFNKALRAAGYRPLKTGLWNNRPAYWIRGSASRIS